MKDLRQLRRLAERIARQLGRDAAKRFRCSDAPLSMAILGAAQAVDECAPSGHKAGGHSAVVRLLPTLPSLVRAELHLRRLGVSAVEAVRRGWRPPPLCRRDAYESLAAVEESRELMQIAAEMRQAGE